MATTHALEPSTSALADSVAEKFRRLAATWKAAVAFHSSNSIRENHPAYLEIIALGPPVVPLLLRDLEETEAHWFAAMARITGANPVTAADAGNIPRMKDAWLRWAQENGYRW